MNINNVYEFIEFAKAHPNYTYTIWDGSDILYDENNNLIENKNLFFNSHLMYVLRKLDILDYINCTISHHQVRNYQINNIQKFEEKVANVKKCLQNLIVKSKDLKIKSLSHLIEYFENDYDIDYDSSYVTYSCYYYRKEQFLNIRDLKTRKIIFSFPYGNAGALKSYGFYNFLIGFYAKLFCNFNLNVDDYREYITPTSFRISKEYNKIRKNIMNETYELILRERENENKICFNIRASF